jgi:hypothetical protein
MEEDLLGRLGATRGASLDIVAVERESPSESGTAVNDDEKLNGQEVEVEEMRLPKEPALNRCPPFYPEFF